MSICSTSRPLVPVVEQHRKQGFRKNQVNPKKIFLDFPCLFTGNFVAITLKLLKPDLLCNLLASLCPQIL
jgi:hypothetical protein